MEFIVNLFEDGWHHKNQKISITWFGKVNNNKMLKGETGVERLSHTSNTR